MIKIKQCCANDILLKSGFNVMVKTEHIVVSALVDKFTVQVTGM